MGQIIKGKPVGDALSDQLKVECEALVKEGVEICDAVYDKVIAAMR